MNEYVKITYVRSAIGRSYRQHRVLKALGLKRLHQSRVMVDCPSLRGMVRKIVHLLKVEAVEQIDIKELVTFEKTNTTTKSREIVESVNKASSDLENDNNA